MHPADTTKRVLIATHTLKDYAGSEVTTLELASTFRDLGWDPRIATLWPGEPMLSAFRAHGLEVLDILADREAIEAPAYDLLWMHHAPVFDELCVAGKLRAGKVVHSCLSPFEPLERMPADTAMIDCILGNSQETAEAIARALGAPDSRVALFPNSVPENFWNHPRRAPAPLPRRVILISNHPPPEALEALGRLRDQGLEALHIGLGGRSVLVTPELLSEADIVVSIGKTVQYCFALGIPIYCYDHFGGPGWLTAGNLDLAEHNNFSGRGFARMSAKEMASSLIGGYAAALSDLERLHLRARERFDLRRNLEKLLDTVQRSARPAAPPQAVALEHHACYMQLLKVARSLQGQLDSERRRHAELCRYVEGHQAMWAWKLSAPLRFVERGIRRWLGYAANRLHPRAP